MRVICKVEKSVKTRDLQKMTNSMSMRQAAKYYSLMDARWIMMTLQPVYLFDKLSTALQERQHNHALP